MADENVKVLRQPARPVIVEGHCLCDGLLVMQSGMTEGHVTTYKYHCYGCGTDTYSEELFPRIEYEVQYGPREVVNYNSYGHRI